MNIENVVKCLEPFASPNLKSVDLNLDETCESAAYEKSRKAWREKLLTHPQVIEWQRVFNVRISSSFRPCFLEMMSSVF